MSNLLNMLDAYLEEIQFEGGTLRKNNNNSWFVDNQFIYEKDGKQKTIDFVFQKYKGYQNSFANEKFLEIYEALSENRKGIVVDLKENKGLINSATYDDVYEKIFEYLNQASGNYLITFQYFMKEDIVVILILKKANEKEIKVIDGKPEELIYLNYKIEQVYLFSMDNKWFEHLKTVWYGNKIDKVDFKLSERFKSTHAEEFI